MKHSQIHGREGLFGRRPELAATGHAPDDGRGRGSVKRCSHRGFLSVRNFPDVQADDSVRGVVIDDPGEVSWVLGHVAVR